MTPLLRLLVWLLLWLPLVPVQVQAEEPQPAAESVPASLATPRTAFATFLHAMNDIKRGQPARLADALEALDLSKVNPLVRREKGPELAWSLLEVLDRTERVNLKRIPNKPDGAPYLFHRYPQGSVHVARQPDGRWQFTSASLEALPAILDGLMSTAKVAGVSDSKEHLPLHLRLREQIPAFLKGGWLLEYWQWLGILLVVAVGVVADKILSVTLRALVRRRQRRSGESLMHQVSENLLRPFGVMLLALVWWLGLNLLGLPSTALVILLVTVKFLAGASGVWGAYRLVDLLTAALTRRARSTASRLDDALVPLLTKTLKVFVTVVGLIFVADNLDIDITSLLAGLGLGGLAFALAAKNVVENLFGSVTVLLDRPFQVGDWVIIGGVEGTVESIGFRSTRIRTFYNSLISVPNSQLITANVDNMGARAYRRLKCKLGIAYDTPPEKVEAFCEGIRGLVRHHPYMRKDYFQVYFNGFGDSALEILVYVFWATPDWSTELRERHRFLLDTLRLAREMGVEFAFPTQTLYVRQEEAPAHEGLGGAEAVEKARAAAAAFAGNSGARPGPVVFSDPGSFTTVPPGS